MKIIAHRGAVAHASENSLEAIKTALKLGFDGIEFDVRSTKDNQAVLLHDSTLERTHDLKKPVSELTLLDIRKINTKNPITTLDQAFETIGRSSKLIVVDIKSPGCVSAVAKYANKSNVYISSKIRSELLALKTLCPEAKLGFVTSNPVHMLVAKKMSELSFMSLHRLIINKKVVRELNIRGKQVFAYPITSKKDLAKMQEAGVEAVFSDTDPADL